MKTNVCLILFGALALSTANNAGRLRNSAVRLSSPLVDEDGSSEEDSGIPAPTVSSVMFRTPVRNVQKAPIRVMAAETLEDQEEQARSAQYSFGAAVDDGIMDHSHIRQETRDGLKVEGSYAYSDGYFKRVVNYVADENGYRVVSESVEPISETGPVIDLINGKADVHTQISGVDSTYSVSAHEIPHLGSLNNNNKKVKA